MICARASCDLIAFVARTHIAARGKKIAIYRTRQARTPKPAGGCWGRAGRLKPQVLQLGNLLVGL